MYQGQRMNATQQLSLMARLSQRLYQLVRVYPVDPVEFIGSVQSTCYGLMLLSPMNTFGSSRSFAAAQRYLTEPVAGALFASVGLLWLAGLLYEHRLTRLVCSLVSAFLFVFWAVMLAQSNVAGGGWLTYGMFAGISAWAFWRQCSRDA